MDNETSTSTANIATRIRRSEGRTGRVYSATAKLTKAEMSELSAVARQEGKAVSEWAREVLLREARKPKHDILLTEFIEFRTVAAWLLRVIALQEPFTNDDLTALMKDARTKKHSRVEETLRYYQQLPAKKGA